MPIKEKTVKKHIKKLLIGLLLIFSLLATSSCSNTPQETTYDILPNTSEEQITNTDKKEGDNRNKVEKGRNNKHHNRKPNGPREKRTEAPSEKQVKKGVNENAQPQN